MLLFSIGPPGNTGANSCLIKIEKKKKKPTESRLFESFSLTEPSDCSRAPKLHQNPQLIFRASVPRSSGQRFLLDFQGIWITTLNSGD